MILRSNPGLPYPQSLPGLLLWSSAYDPANTGVPAAAGGLASWVNKTGVSANSSTQGTGVSQPVVTLNSLNGKPSLLFTVGVGTNLVNGAQTVLQLPANYSIFALAALTSSASTNQCILCKGVQDYIFMLNRTTATSKLSLFDGANWHDSTATVGTTTNYNFLGATSDGVTISLYSNGTDLGTSGTVGNPTTSATNLLIGAQNGPSNFFGGNLVEVLIYKSTLSFTQVKNLSNFFANFYGLNF